jgi:hypothetical protein
MGKMNTISITNLISKIKYYASSLFYYNNLNQKKYQKNIIAFSYTKSTVNEIFPIYKELKKRGYPIILIFSGRLKKDKRYSKGDFIPQFFLNKLDAKVIVSDGGGNWGDKYETIAIFHGFASLDCGFQRSFIENYKHIFMRMQYHEKQLVSPEFLNLAKGKKIYRVGAPKLDGEIKKVSNPLKLKYKSFFYAPTYHIEISSIFTFLDEIVKYTKERKIDLSIKLHPYLYRKYSYEASGKIDWKREMYKLSQKYNHIKIIPDEITFNELRDSFENFDIIITDTSAMAYEFTLITGKPAVFVGEKLKIKLEDLRNKNLEKYMKYPEVHYRYEKLGPTIGKPEDFTKKMDEFESNFAKYNESIKEFRNNFTYNLGNATKVAVNHILEILK